MTSDPAGPSRTGLSVVIPCFNEVDNIEPVYREVVGEFDDLDLELLFVDDGSTDGTLDKIKELAETDPRVEYISFTRNFGFEAAFSAGYRYAGKPWILHLDADQQFPAADGRTLIATAETGYDAVFGVRGNRQDPLLRRWGTTAFHYLAGTVLRIEVPRGATAFRLVRTELARTIVDLHLGTPYFLATVPKLTSRYTTVLVGHRARRRGHSKVGFGWLIRHAIELFVGFGRRLSTVVATGSVVAAALSVLLGLAAATGLLGPRGTSAALFALLATALIGLAMVVRHQVVIAAGQPRPRLFYVREASIPVTDADLLFGGGSAAEVRLTVEPPAQQRRRDPDSLVHLVTTGTEPQQ